MKKGPGDTFQEETKYTRGKLPGGPLIWSSKPKTYKSYPDATRIDLDPPDREGGLPLWQAITHRQSIRSFKNKPLASGHLSQLLWATQGIIREEMGFEFRTSPSAGALYPVETYVIIHNVENVDQGIYHYAVREHQLEQHVAAVSNGRVRALAEGNRKRGAAWLQENEGDVPRRYPKGRRVKSALDNYNEGELNELVRLAKKPILRYLTRYGIMSHWNFVGVVINVSRGTSQEAFDQTDSVAVVNVGLGKRVRTTNIWGTRKFTEVGTKQDLILTRKELSDGTFGAFQYLPYSRRTREYALGSSVRYGDLGDQLVRGRVLPIGTVIEPCDRNPQESRREFAAGIAAGGNTKLAYEAHGTLPQFYIAVGM